MAQQGKPRAAMTKNLVGSNRPSSSFFSRQKPRNGTAGYFERSAVPSRFMYYHDDSWVDFSADVVQVLRTGFLEQRPIIQASIDGATFIFDLKRMFQIDFATGNHRSISWIDANDNCFFPEQGFTEFDNGNENDDNINCICQNNNKNNNSCDHKIADEIKIHRNSPERQREEEPEVNSSHKAVGIDVIKHQRSEEEGAARWPNSRPLRESESTYLIVRYWFLNGVRKVDGGVRVTSIHQCIWDGHLSKARLEVFKKQIEITNAARGTSNMVLSWYGASAKAVEIILAHGFGLLSEVPPTDVYGVGVYLSPLELPQLSVKLADADDNGIKHLILCRVILGNVEKVEAGSLQYHPSVVDLDTGSDDPKNPKWYVIWSTNVNMHILPQFVVSFNTSGNMQGEPRPYDGRSISLSKVLNSLPPDKAREVCI